MSATKILWGQVIVVCFVVLAFEWGATEWTAWQLGFQPELGPPWLELFGWPFYLPPAFFWWWFSFDAYAHDIFVDGGYIAGTGGIASFAVAMGMAGGLARAAKATIPYCSGPWATAPVNHAA